MKIEVTNIETSNTRIMSVRDFYQMFGKHEAREILAGNLPNICAVKIADDTETDTLVRGK